MRRIDGEPQPRLLDHGARRGVGRVGAAVAALDVVESRPDALVVDVSCNTMNADRGTQVQEALAALGEVTVLHTSNRTFLKHLGGKLEIVPKVPLLNRDDLSRAYTPGVAHVCFAIAERPEDARNLTVKRNTIAVVTDGSAVLGLGNIGPAATLPVMEGKAALFKQFADVDAWPVCLDTQDSDEVVRIVKAIAPVCGGVNLEDNQINNVLAFPGFFRGLLDAHAVHITLAMLVAAADAIAKRVTDDELHASYIIPSMFDPLVAGDVAAGARTDESDSLTAGDERLAA
jgi:malate dehydrogenase (oxaloacetate-decarboxylating)